MNQQKPLVCQPLLPARFWNKVKKTNKCWLWTAAQSDGYGLFWWQGKLVAAHRLAFESMRGPIPPGCELDHICRRRHCVKPNHLQPVKHRENVIIGRNFTAVNSAKVCCPKGHAYTVVKRAAGRGTQRRCLICANEQARQRTLAKFRAKWDRIYADAGL